jgi:hypothetical protein
MNATTSSTKSEKPIGEDAANGVDETCGHLARNNWSDGSVTCRDCNATLSPVDAANGAIGERARKFKLTDGEIEACSTEPAILRVLANSHEDIASGAETMDDEVRASYHITRASELNARADAEEREMQDRGDYTEPSESCAALTAEKVAAEPVAWFYYEYDEFIRMYDSEEKVVAACEKFGGHWEPVFKHSARQHDRFDPYRLKVAEECCERLMSACTDAGCPDGVRMDDWIRDTVARAASTQSTATQPAQTQVALTDEQMMTAIKSVCGFDADKAEQWRPEALAIGRAVERALLREAGSN